MGLNIKNERVHDLIRTAAARTGKTQTGVVEEAVRTYLDALDHEGNHARAERLLADLRASVGAAARPAVDDLYDSATGLPA